MRNLLPTGLIAIALLIPSVGAQTSPDNTEIIANGSLLHSLLAKPVIGQPYSAVQVHATKRQLADGTNISHSGHHFVARDASGRVRVEMRLANAADGKPETILVFVADPEARTVTTWMTGPNANRLATVAKMKDEKSGTTKPAPTPIHQDTRPKPIVTTEDLGFDTLQGVSVAVAKTTTIVPAGRSGNDAPIIKIHEVWTSPDMKLVLKEQWEDPRSGERTLSLEKFSRTAPEPSLFHPPADYKVQDVVQTLQDLEEKLNAAQN